jgi:hypothetical protein
VEGLEVQLVIVGLEIVAPVGARLVVAGLVRAGLVFVGKMVAGFEGAGLVVAESDAPWARIHADGYRQPLAMSRFSWNADAKPEILGLR